jgi:hypothetical protein
LIDTVEVSLPDPSVVLNPEFEGKIRFAHKEGEWGDADDEPVKAKQFASKATVQAADQNADLSDSRKKVKQGVVKSAVEFVKKEPVKSVSGSKKRSNNRLFLKKRNGRVMPDGLWYDLNPVNADANVFFGTSGIPVGKIENGKLATNVELPLLQALISGSGVNTDTEDKLQKAWDSSDKFVRAYKLKTIQGAGTFESLFSTDPEEFVWRVENDGYAVDFLTAFQFIQLPAGNPRGFFESPTDAPSWDKLFEERYTLKMNLTIGIEPNEVTAPVYGFLCRHDNYHFLVINRHFMTDESLKIPHKEAFFIFAWH